MHYKYYIQKNAVSPIALYYMSCHSLHPQSQQIIERDPHNRGDG